MRIPFLIFIVVPLVEMLLLFEVSAQIGPLTTLTLVVLTAVVGLSVLKRQGFQTLTRANQRMASGQLPAQEIVEGMLLAISGIFLLVPGFITDTIGIVFLISPMRASIARRAIRSGSGFMFGGFGPDSGPGPGFGPGAGRRKKDDGNTFEGEYSSESDPRPGLDRKDDRDD